MERRVGAHAVHVWWFRWRQVYLQRMRTRAFTGAAVHHYATTLARHVFRRLRAVTRVRRSLRRREQWLQQRRSARLVRKRWRMWRAAYHSSRVEARQSARARALHSSHLLQRAWKLWLVAMHEQAAMRVGAVTWGRLRRLVTVVLSSRSPLAFTVCVQGGNRTPQPSHSWALPTTLAAAGPRCGTQASSSRRDCNGYGP